MSNGRKTTLEERTEIVAFCIANGKDYGVAAEKYGVSYQQVYSRVHKYEGERRRRANRPQRKSKAGR